MKQLPKKHAIAPLPIAILFGSLAIAFSILISTGVTYIASQNPKQPTQQQAFENISYVTVAQSPTLGSKNAPVTVIEYTDFDCPICESATKTTLPDLQKEYIATGKVKFIFKSLPIVSLHSNAFRKTEAAFCAREQGGDDAFFQYYNALFSDFGFAISIDETLTSLAQAQSLRIDQFQQCLQNSKTKHLVAADTLEGNLIGAVGTPTWLVAKSNGIGIKDAVKVTGLIPYSDFKIIIDRMLP